MLKYVVKASLPYRNMGGRPQARDAPRQEGPRVAGVAWGELAGDRAGPRRARVSAAERERGRAVAPEGRGEHEGRPDRVAGRQARGARREPRHAVVVIVGEVVGVARRAAEERRAELVERRLTSRSPRTGA